MPVKTVMPESRLINLQPSLSWQEEMQQLICTPEELLSCLELPGSLLKAAIQAADAFPLRVPRAFVRKMKKGDVNDPLLRQVLPIRDELFEKPNYSIDPLLESDSNVAKGIIHKYQGRVLLMAAPSCAVNCRYCFRRHFPYQDNNPSRDEWLAVFDSIRADSSITEVIFSGGDPLMNSDKQLAWMVEQLESISHVRRLRFHTRLPVVIPQRIDDSLLNWLDSVTLKTVFVLHINHANEIDRDLALRIDQLRVLGITVLNQAVLLKGVNDTLGVQIELSEKLFSCGVLPYYLHLLDRVQGAAHFECAHDDALQLHRQMQENLPGYLVPKLVAEEPNHGSKTWVV
jgi:EF-P beta-lysylation protein EpmB